MWGGTFVEVMFELTQRAVGLAGDAVGPAGGGLVLAALIGAMAAARLDIQLDARVVRAPLAPAPTDPVAPATRPVSPITPVSPVHAARRRHLAAVRRHPARVVAGAGAGACQGRVAMAMTGSVVPRTSRGMLRPERRPPARRGRSEPARWTSART